MECKVNRFETLNQNKYKQKGNGIQITPNKASKMAQKNYYAIVHKANGSPLVLSSMLPIYWNKRVASEVVKNHPNYTVKPVSISELNKLLQNQPH